MKSSEERIEMALGVAFSYSQIDGAHHKAWIIDQMVRALLGIEKYDDWVKEYEKNDEDEDDPYEWDKGIAP